MMTDSQDMTPLRMVFPCLFYQMASFECALCRYSLGSRIKETIRNTLESVLRGLNKKRENFKQKRKIN